MRKIDPDGIITTVAGTGTQGFSGDGGPATLANLNYPNSVDIGPDGSLYIAEVQRVRRVDPNGIISTFAGAQTCGNSYCGDGQPAYGSAIYQPAGVAAGPDGSVYIAQSAYHVIRRVKPDGIIETFAGTGSFGYSGEGLPAIDFATFVLSLSHSALLHLGDAPDPASGTVSVNLPMSHGRARIEVA